MFPPSRILVSDSIPGRAAEVSRRHGVVPVPSVAELAEQSDILVLAAKPKDMPVLVRSVATHVHRDGLVVTLAAGVRTDFVGRELPGGGGGGPHRDWQRHSSK